MATRPKAQDMTAEEERVAREQAERELAEIKAFEEEAGRPPTRDELAEKRAARETADADAALEQEMGGRGVSTAEAEKPGHTAGLAQQALETGDAPEEGEEDDGQRFVWEQGRKVTLGTLIARSVPVEHHFVFGGRRTKGTGGLMGFDANPIMVVRGKPGPVKIVPTYNDDETVKKVVIESHVIAVVVHNADSADGLALLGDVLAANRYIHTPDAA
jgi:hypothetical protein